MCIASLPCSQSGREREVSKKVLGNTAWAVERRDNQCNLCSYSELATRKCNSFVTSNRYFQRGNWVLHVCRYSNNKPSCQTEVRPFIYHFNKMQLLCVWLQFISSEVLSSICLRKLSTVGSNKVIK